MYIVDFDVNWWFWWQHVCNYLARHMVMLILITQIFNTNHTPVLYSPPCVLPESAELIWTHLDSRYVTYRHMVGLLESGRVKNWLKSKKVDPLELKIDWSSKMVDPLESTGVCQTGVRWSQKLTKVQNGGSAGVCWTGVRSWPNLVHSHQIQFTLNMLGWAKFSSLRPNS